jgi:hypothetical protein
MSIGKVVDAKGTVASSTVKLLYLEKEMACTRRSTLRTYKYTEGGKEEKLTGITAT